MKRTAIIIIIAINILGLCSCAGWSRQDTYRELAWGVIHTIDWRQTRRGQETGYIETGPAKLVIGERPGKSRVDNYFVAGYALHALVSAALPDEDVIFGYHVRPRQIWQYLSIGGSAYCVGNNLSVGLGFGW